MAKGTRFCEWCDKEFHPDKSNADDKERYCCQGCEALDIVEESEDSGDLDFENDDD